MAAITHRNALKPKHKILWYEIKEILGQGGFGITYLAYDPNLNKDVAIKEYLPIELAVRERNHSIHPISEDRVDQYEWGLDRFMNEARNLAKFNHPNIVRVLSITEENNTAYMVMPYESGQSLQMKLKGKKTLDEEHLIKIIFPILDGLEHIHNSGFIHRDIKPDNIFIREDGSPILLDFGSARKALGEKTQTLTSLVSSGFAPFEQYHSKSNEQGPWTDIYGLGATLYRAISGISPLSAIERSNNIIKFSKDRMVTAKEIGNGKYSEQFLIAIDHSLQYNREDRPQTITEWRKEFNEHKARELYEQSAAQGNASAQYNLGKLYAKGQAGLPKDRAKAAELYKAAAEQGDQFAQNNLAAMYEKGQGGLLKDVHKARELYEQSAAQGNQYAIKNLQRLS